MMPESRADVRPDLRPDTRHEPLEVLEPATVWGIDRGREFGGPARVAVHAEGVVVVLASAGEGRERRIAYPLSAIDGVGAAAAQLTLYLHGGDVLEVTGDTLGAARMTALAQRLETLASELPEQTLALRGLGSPRAYPGSDHDRFYGPLLRARRLAADAETAAERLAAFDSAVLRREVEQAGAAFAGARHPESAPDRRALEAELLDCAEALLEALDALDAAARSVRESPDEARFARWRDWGAAVRRVFGEADRCWMASLPALCDPRGADGRFWRRVVGRGRA
jgi:hypothetical protein